MPAPTLNGIAVGVQYVSSADVVLYDWINDWKHYMYMNEMMGDEDSDVYNVHKSIIHATTQYTCLCKILEL